MRWGLSVSGCSYTVACRSLPLAPEAVAPHCGFGVCSCTVQLASWDCSPQVTAPWPVGWCSAVLWAPWWLRQRCCRSGGLRSRVHAAVGREQTEAAAQCSQLPESIVAHSTASTHFISPRQREREKEGLPRVCRSRQPSPSCRWSRVEKASLWVPGRMQGAGSEPLFRWQKTDPYWA